MKYSKETYRETAKDLVYYFLGEADISKDKISSVSIDDDETYGRFNLTVVYDDVYGRSSMKIAVQFCPLYSDMESAYLDVVKCAGDQTMYHFNVDLNDNKITDPVTYDLVCSIDPVTDDFVCSI